MLTQISCVAAQSPADGERFVRLGLSKDRLLVTGNVKFDLHLPTSVIQEGKSLRKSWGERLTLMAASTHEGEEIIVLEAFADSVLNFPMRFNPSTTPPRSVHESSPAVRKRWLFNREAKSPTIPDTKNGHLIGGYHGRIGPTLCSKRRRLCRWQPGSGWRAQFN